MDNKKKKDFLKKTYFFIILIISLLQYKSIKPSSPKKIHNDPSGDMLPPLFHDSLSTQSDNFLQNRPHQTTLSEKKHILNFIKSHLEKHNSIIMPEDIMNLSLDEDILYIADRLEQAAQQLNSITNNPQKQLEIVKNYLK